LLQRVFYRACKSMLHPLPLWRGLCRTFYTAL
jgi:hypothetical protein